MGKYDLAIRFVAIGLYASLFIFIYTPFSIAVWNVEIVSETFTRYYWILGYFVGLGLEMGLNMFLPIILSVLGIVLGIEIISSNVYISSVTSFIQSMWHYPTSLPPELLNLLTTATTLFGPIQGVSLYLLQPIIYSLFPILFIITIVSIMIYFLTGTPRFAIIAFAALQGLVVVASIQIPEIFLRSTTLGYLPIPFDIISFFSTEIFFITLLSYFFLESVYISDYLKQMLDPQSKREKWIINQLQEVERAAAQPISATGDSQIITGSQFTRLHGSDSFTFIREILEKRIFRRKRGHEDYISKQNIRKLHSYMQQVQRKNPAVLDRLTAKTAKPNMLQILFPVIIGTSIRTIFLILISFFVIHPVFILTALQAPIPVLESIEAVSPEMSLFILIPIVLIFIFSGLLTRVIIEQSPTTEKEAQKILAETTSGTTITAADQKIIEKKIEPLEDVD